MNIGPNSKLYEEYPSIPRAFARSAGLSLLAPIIATPWALRKEASIGAYSLMIAGNLVLASLPSFLIREAIGDHLDSTTACGLSGAIGGSFVYGMYAGAPRIPKGFVVFGLVGIAMDQASIQLENWRIDKRNEIIAQRNYQKQVSSPSKDQ